MMIPAYWWGKDEYNKRMQERRKEAERQVRAKFPALLEGTPGWSRAVRNRLARIKG